MPKYLQIFFRYSSKYNNSECFSQLNLPHEIFTIVLLQKIHNLLKKSNNRRKNRKMNSLLLPALTKNKKEPVIKTSPFILLIIYLKLVSVMSKCFVCFSHFMGIFTFFAGCTDTVRSIDKFKSKLINK